MESLRIELTEYVDLISEIRVLSAVQIDESAGADAYARKLKRDYARIGVLGERCREILKKSLMPVLEKEEALSGEELKVLQEFSEMLLEPASGEELDLFLLQKVSGRLLRELREQRDYERYAKQLNIHVSVCYANVNRTARITVSRTFCTDYRDEGLRAAEEAKRLLYDREAFLALSVEARIQILRAVRFYSALYDTFFYETETNEARFQALLDALSLSEDPFYLNHSGDYPWELHRCRCMEHMGQLTERGNRWGFTREQCREILGWVETLSGDWEKDPETRQRILPEMHLRLLLCRNRYFAGVLPVEEYRKALLDLYEEYADSKYDMYAVQANLLIPTEYLTTLQGERISAETETLLGRLYHRVLDYVLHSVNMDAFNYLQEYLTAFLESFIELSGAMQFEEMGLSCIAALHPPTYVHSLEVADLSRCLAEHLGRRHPELFAEEYGYGKEEVKKKLPHIYAHIYRCALCHDFGKLAMIDSIFIYGRDFLPGEYEMIRLHTLLGAEMLERHSSTRSLAQLARTHHLWYSHKGGYPEGERTSFPVAAGILAVADSIDAATDSIGRSYRKGKDLSEVCAEIFEEEGDRYSPAVAELLKDPGVICDLKFLITAGRQQKYRRAYQMLSGVEKRLVS